MNEALDKREIDPKITTFFIIHQKIVYTEHKKKRATAKNTATLQSPEVPSRIELLYTVLQTVA